LTTKFESIEAAKSYAAYLAGVDPKTTKFIEDPKLKVEDISCILLDDPNTSEEIKKEIRNRIAAQKGFRFKNKDGKEVSIVIGPFRDGFDLWLIAENGWAVRV
jgi:hypothetical protein